jgi:hypothetical protein
MKVPRRTHLGSLTGTVHRGWQESHPALGRPGVKARHNSGQVARRNHFAASIALFSTPCPRAYISPRNNCARALSWPAANLNHVTASASSCFVPLPWASMYPRFVLALVYVTTARSLALLRLLLRANHLDPVRLCFNPQHGASGPTICRDDGARRNRSEHRSVLT